MTTTLAGFIIGFFVGGMFGVFAMVILTASREFDFDDELIRREGGGDASN